MVSAPLPHRSVLRAAILTAGILSIIAAAPARSAATSHRAATSPARSTLHRPPLAFEPAMDAAVTRFIARGQGHALTIDATGFEIGAPGAARVRVGFIRANGEAKLVPREQLRGTAKDAAGSDRARWPRSGPAFARVVVRDVYPGIDVAYSGTHRQLEFDFIVRPGADPNLIRLAVERADARLDRGGELVIATAQGEVRLRRPVVYQDVAGHRAPLDGRFVERDGIIRFRLGRWDRRYALTTDPRITARGPGRSAA